MPNFLNEDPSTIKKEQKPNSLMQDANLPVSFSMDNFFHWMSTKSKVDRKRIMKMLKEAGVIDWYLQEKEIGHV